MRNPKLLTIAALAASLTLGAAASITAAQDAPRPAATPQTGMMGGGNMMGMMSEMKGMMESCNRMMQGMMQMMPSTPAAPSATSPEKKG